MCTETKQNIIEKFAPGYHIRFQIKSFENPLKSRSYKERIDRLMRYYFPDCQLLFASENGIGLLTYNLNINNSCLSLVFSRLEKLRNRLPPASIVDFQVSTGNLEAVLQKFITAYHQSVS